MTEFIIVGQGLAAGVLLHSFHQHGISFKVIGDGSLSNCSRVAAGIWNPVVFKRMTKSWLADELVAELNSFYSSCEKQLHQTLLTQRPIVKPFVEEQEKRLWQKKYNAELQHFLDPEIYATLPPELDNCNIANGYGRVLHSGNLDVAGFLEATFSFFKEHHIPQCFDHSRLQVFDDKVVYDATEAKNIIFCEGHLVKHNPFFSWIPLKPAKGEVLTISAPALRFRHLIFNKNGFLMDVGNGLFRLGATYEWQELNDEPTPKGLAELTGKLTEMTAAACSVVKHEAGVRPSSLDRRPLIGAHPKHNNLFVFNGLGTKGVMLAPFFSKNFVFFYLQKQELHPEADLARFYHLYESHQA